jgi:hypothetical protein
MDTMRIAENLPEPISAKMKVQVRIADQVIIQEIVTESSFTPGMEATRIQELNTADKQIRQALIKMGWTPPANSDICSGCGTTKQECQDGAKEGYMACCPDCDHWKKR